MDAKVTMLARLPSGSRLRNALLVLHLLQSRIYTRLKRPPLQPWTAVFVLLILFAPSLPGASPSLATTQASAHVHPALVALANEHPDARIDVIVQWTDQSGDIEASVAHLGGRVIGNLMMIHAFVAQLPARAVTELGRAPGVHWISLDSEVQSSLCFRCIDTSHLASAYIRTIRADKVWNRPPYLQGRGIGVAVVDSGINRRSDLDNSRWGIHRLIAKVVFNGDPSGEDDYGHGDHVARIIGSNGGKTGKYIGVAPDVNLINVKVANDEGAAKISDMISGLQWIFENRDRYNIRVVNISMNDSVLESYRTSALDAAVEVLWFNGIVVVVSAGNTTNGGIYAPANDPFVITVGATDDRGTADISDDIIAPFSAYGQTIDGYPKPDLVAPGTNIVSLLTNLDSVLAKLHPSHIIQTRQRKRTYFRMSGTSMSAPMVAGAAALLIQSNPKLTPDQVKYRLIHTSHPFDTPTRAGAGYLDVNAAVQGTTTQKENQGLVVSPMLWGGSIPLIWDSVTEVSVNWRGHGTAFWGSANQNGDVNNSVFWGSDYWDSVQAAQAAEPLIDESLTADDDPLIEDDVNIQPQSNEPVIETSDTLLFTHQVFLPLITADTP
jgi:serine protease AprX